MGEIINAYNNFVGNPEGKRPRGKHKRRWKYNIEMGVTEKGGKL
jgi:hypothetical protein